MHLKFEVYGDKKDTAKSFHWNRIKFNLPGSRSYRSDLPWIMKTGKDGHLIAEIFVYVGNGRATGYSWGLMWRVARAYSSGCSRWGIQDASRKWTSPTEFPGPWSGTVTSTKAGSLMGMVSQEKWDKTKALLKVLTDMLGGGICW